MVTEQRFAHARRVRFQDLCHDINRSTGLARNPFNRSEARRIILDGREDSSGKLLSFVAKVNEGMIRRTKMLQGSYLLL